MRALTIAVIVVLVLPLVVGCDDNSAKKPNELLQQMKKETALMANVEQAEPELEQRLQAKVSVVDGLLFVNDPVLREVSVLPTTTPWVIQCGMITGFSITFGSSVSGAEGNVQNEVEVSLSTGQIDQKNCYVLGRRLGKRLQSMLLRDQSVGSTR